MRLAIHLLGPPRVEHDGVAAHAPRGTKTWALLAYLILTRTSVPRSRAAGLLFAEADDPVGALRWTLSQLRGLLGTEARVKGEPLELALPARTMVDTEIVSGGSWAEALSLPGFGAELLEGVTFRTSAAFELWLTGERRRLAGASQAMLHEAALSRLAGGNPTSAAELATRLVALNPLDENAQILLVRSLRASGDPQAAEDQVAACRALFRRELGVEPTPSLLAASRSAAAGEATVTGRAAVLAQLDAGVAAGHAGAYDLAVEALRRAVVGARAGADVQLLARALLSLGSMLVHGIRGADEDGLPALHEASALAEQCGSAQVAATARRELAYVEMLRANYPRMERWLADASAVADGDDAELAWIEAVAGLGRSDIAEYGSAATTLDSAQERARAAGDERAFAFAAAGAGRLRLLREELADAGEACQRSYDASRQLGWTSFMPWPEALLGEVALRRGEADRAGDRFEHAYTLGSQVGDPCWESLALRGRGLLAAARGDDPLALDLLTRAPAVCRRLPDTYDWITGYGLDALSEYTVKQGLDSAGRWVDELDDFASRRGLRELLARAARHRARLGQPGSAELAAVMAEGIDNPALG